MINKVKAQELLYFGRIATVSFVARLRECIGASLVHDASVAPFFLGRPTAGGSQASEARNATLWSCLRASERTKVVPARC
jgi:hypothetical protein